MSNELVENVARALYAIEWGELGGPYDEQDEIDKTYWMRGATAAVNLVLEAAAERADAIKRENAESRDKHEPGIEPGHDDWISYNHGVFTAGEIADAIRALKGESK